jgi:hypothetical protein
MTPALIGAQSCEHGEFIYFAGGQNDKNEKTNIIYKVKKENPTAIEKAGTMSVPRVDPFFFQVGKHFVIMGGSDKPAIDVLDEKMVVQKGFDAKSTAFFKQLASYTSDEKLENCSYG